MKPKTHRVVKIKTLFCKWLREELDRNNLTQTMVAHQLGVGPSMISDLCTGRYNPTLMQVTALCYVFKSPDDPEWVWSLSKEEL